LVAENLHPGPLIAGRKREVGSFPSFLHPLQSLNLLQSRPRLSRWFEFAKKKKKKCPANRLSGPLAVNAYRIRTLQSQVDQSLGKNRGEPGYFTRKQRANRRRLIRRLWNRIVRVVDDIHRKLISMLINKFAIILIPKFNVSRMVRRGGHRVIGKKSSANLLRWAHYKFRMRLIAAAKYTACSVVEVNEAYTSKTCTGCGELNNTLGGQRVFHCDSCGISLPRYANGSRNILIRFLLRFIEAYDFFQKESAVSSGARYDIHAT
jgi:IS605 OrfB family transposase